MGGGTVKNGYWIQIVTNTKTAIISTHDPLLEQLTEHCIEWHVCNYGAGCLDSDYLDMTKPHGLIVIGESPWDRIPSLNGVEPEWRIDL